MTYQILNTENPRRDPRSRPCIKAVERTPPTSATTYCLNKIQTLIHFDEYRPELHYMRGPGPKWHAKYDLAFASLDVAIGGSRIDNECVRDADNEARRSASLSVKRAESRMLQAFKNWPNTTVAAICAGILSVVFLLSIATLLIASSSSSANAEPPGDGCVAVSQGEYQGAYRKKLLLTRFGTYERTGRLGQYYYWYCR